MTEAEIRKMVRDELEAEALKEGGIYDHVRKVAFNMLCATFRTQAQSTLDMFRDSDAGLN